MNLDLIGGLVGLLVWLLAALAGVLFQIQHHHHNHGRRNPR